MLNFKISFSIEGLYLYPFVNILIKEHIKHKIIYILLRENSLI